ncbi:MAG: hypothetical protein KatS3mg096_415 [Candidatus Parcubacteria bacterium]|nr:MAG: hypothetical protein KatS3mg096_415 [Candidatus Parcubacteria bacterium]
MLNNFKKILITVIIVSILFSFLNVNLTISEEMVKCQFKRHLFPGLKGDDVKCLQTFLKQSGYFSGPVTGYYDDLTKEAVIEWQKTNNIFPAHGYFTLASRKFYLNLINKQQLTNQIKQQEQYRLVLPEIKDDEIIIDNDDGFNQIDLYFKHIFIDNIPKIDYNELERLFKTEPFSLEFLIDKTLNNENFDKQLIKQKTELFENFYKQRLSILKKVSISKNLIDLHKTFIVSDILSQELVTKFNDYLDGKVSKEDFDKYYKEYKEKINFLKTSFNLASVKYSNNTKDLLSLLMGFLIKPAFAQTSLVFKPFGGRILFTLICSCNLGRLIYVGPPRLITLFVPLGFEASPLVYLWKNTYTPGVWLLGLTFHIPVSCLIITSSACAPVGSGSLIYMTGTSLIP